MPPVRLIPLLGLSLLTACAQQPAHNVTLEDQSDCPQQLHVGQQLILSLPSNPTTGFRWAIQDSAGGVLRSLGPEVYTSSDNGQLEQCADDRQSGRRIVGIDREGQRVREGHQ